MPNDLNYYYTDILRISILFMKKYYTHTHTHTHTKLHFCLLSCAWFIKCKW